MLGHRLSLLSLHAGALEFRPDASPAQLAGAASVVRDQARLALQDLREVIGVLRDERDDEMRPQPTLGQVADLVEESRRAGMAVDSRLEVPDVSAVPDAIGRSAYRIVQEALTNARKHAPGCEVHLNITGAAGDGLAIAVTNRCVSSEACSGGGGSATGLVGLGERASLVGGRLEHGRQPDGTFLLRAWLPWPA